jgi:cytochrome c oxidase assembly protein subunit 15
VRVSSPAGSLARWAWAVLGYNLLVILWGAWVRVSGSGAGCGSHWPLCDGEVIPRAPSAEKLIEFTHRATSGLALLAVVALAVAVFRTRPAGDPARRAAVWTVVFMLIEAAVGAGLVLFELVADNASMARALFMAVHLANTFLLLAALARTCERLGEPPPAPPLGRESRLVGRVALVLLVVAGASGAVAALGDTLFPSRTLTEALAADLSPTSHLLIRLRIGHPLMATAAAVAVLLFAVGVLRAPGGGRRELWARRAAALVLAKVVVGLANVALLAPPALQLLHLLLADLVWIAVVLALEGADG